MAVREHASLKQLTFFKFDGEGDDLFFPSVPVAMALFRVDASPGTQEVTSIHPTSSPNFASLLYDTFTS